MDWDSQESMMVLTIHNLAKAYGVLPSEALATATTFDLYVLDVHSKWTAHQHEQQQNQHNPIAPKTRQHSQESLQAMIQRVREQENERKNKQKLNE